jgi:hypothetical protein
MGVNPSGRKEESLPVTSVKYADAIAFTRELSKSINLRVTLPTEAQWEYACRAGSDKCYCFGDDAAQLVEYAWYDANTEDPRTTGSRRANAWGLYDMHGNVWEMCADYIEDYAKIGDTDPVGRISPRQGMLRGGAWLGDAADCRCASRIISSDMFGGAGIRLCINPDQLELEVPDDCSEDVAEDAGPSVLMYAPHLESDAVADEAQRSRRALERSQAASQQRDQMRANRLERHAARREALAQERARRAPLAEEAEATRAQRPRKNER